jgi:hypothetical protein
VVKIAAEPADKSPPLENFVEKCVPLVAKIFPWKFLEGIDQERVDTLTAPLARI